jgi:hypothetical protein
MIERPILVEDALPLNLSSVPIHFNILKILATLNLVVFTTQLISKRPIYFPCFDQIIILIAPIVFCVYIIRKCGSHILRVFE